MIARAATSYLRAGLCVLPAILDEKRPALGAWKAYQQCLPSEAQVAQWPRGHPHHLCNSKTRGVSRVDFG